MQKPSAPKKRLPHGMTLQLVMGAVALLAHSGKPVTRAALHQALAASGLTATTIDDRIHALIKRRHIVRERKAGGYTLPGSHASSPPTASAAKSPAKPVLPTRETAPPVVKDIAPRHTPTASVVPLPKSFPVERFDFDQARGRPAKRKRP